METFQDFNYEIINETITITKYNGTSISVEIPAFIDNFPVTALGNRVFWGCANLRIVIIPESINSIGFGAFRDCSELSEIIVSNNNQNYKSLDNVLFDTNKNIIHTYPSKKPNKIYDIPEGTTAIGDNAFFGVSKKLIGITIPESVISIGDAAFYGCSGINSLLLPQSITKIGNRAFWGCSKLSKVELSKSLTSIGGAAFVSCESLQSISIPESISEIKVLTFYTCKNLSTVNLSASVTTIGESAFVGCEKLNNIKISDNVTSIGERAFEDCSTDFTFITSPESYAAKWAFENGIKTKEN